jgi:hypothetical protein
VAKSSIISEVKSLALKANEMLSVAEWFLHGLKSVLEIDGTFVIKGNCVAFCIHYLLDHLFDGVGFIGEEVRWGRRMNTRRRLLGKTLDLTGMSKGKLFMGAIHGLHPVNISLSLWYWSLAQGNGLIIFFFCMIG